MKKKQVITSVCLIIILFVAVIGISYAAFTYIGKGSTVNQITTGTISMTYEESTNVIKITNALPTRDETGKVRLVEGEYFDFSVTINLSGSAVINWEIAAEDFSDNTFDGSNVKFYLTRLDGDIETPVNETLPKVYSEEQEENISTGRPSGKMSLLVGSTSTVGEETTNYRLRLYVDENYNPQGDGGGLIFKTRINVYGKVSPDEIPVKPTMRAYTQDSTEDYHAEEYRSKVTSITTKKDTIVPATAIEVSNGKGNYWDVSALGDDSVIAYAEDNGNGGYKITIGGKNGILSNIDSSYLFYNFNMLTDINLMYFNTSNVINMRGIFNNCSNLVTLELSQFNTTKVTDMSFMFCGCNCLIEIDVSNFDTSNVTSMLNMFNSCNNIRKINCHKFNTSKVTTMEGMFYQCYQLASIDLSEFKTTNVTNMQGMFVECKSLTSINLNSFDTSKVTNMEYMFNGCSNLQTIDLKNFNTSNVEKMSAMFCNCNNLQMLDLSNFNTLKVVDMSNMFYSCFQLENINLSSFNTSNVKNMWSMFAECRSLTSLDISEFDTSKVTNMETMFYNCSSLISLNLKNFNTSNVINMNAMFAESTKLNNILVSNDWKVSQATTTNMFYRCGTNKVTVV